MQRGGAGAKFVVFGASIKKTNDPIPKPYQGVVASLGSHSIWGELGRSATAFGSAFATRNFEEAVFGHFPEFEGLAGRLIPGNVRCWMQQRAR